MTSSRLLGITGTRFDDLVGHACVRVACPLVERGRLRLTEPLRILRVRTLEAGIKEMVVDAPIAMLASQLRGFHGDPVDRILVEHDAVLLTADEALLGWASGLRSLDARR